jgi:hypothetical protein
MQKNMRPEPPLHRTRSGRLPHIKNGGEKHRRSRSRSRQRERRRTQRLTLERRITEVPGMLLNSTAPELKSTCYGTGD